MLQTLEFGTNHCCSSNHLVRAGIDPVDANRFQVVKMRQAVAGLSSARASIARHRHNMASLENTASSQSRRSRSLDWMNFFIADVQEAFGAFIAFYLADLKWSQESVGLMLT